MLDLGPPVLWYQPAKSLGESTLANRLAVARAILEDTLQHLRQDAGPVTVGAHPVQREHHYRGLLAGLLKQATDGRIAGDVHVAQRSVECLELRRDGEPLRIVRSQSTCPAR